MNILLLSWRGPGHPNAGGAEISTHEHARGWVKAGHNVTLFTSYYEGAKKQESIDGVMLIRKGRQFFEVQWEAFKWYMFTDHPRYDLVIDEFHGIPFFTPFYVKTEKLGFIHEVTKEVWKLNQFPIPFAGAIGIIAEPLIFKLYRGIPFMTVSQSTKDDLICWGIPADNITVIHNGVGVSSLQRTPKKEKRKTLIYLGALAKDKGIEDAISAFYLLSKTSKDWQFWVIGKSDPEYLKELKKQSNRLKLQKQIKFWGFVSEQRKFELLARAHILVNPSVREGWGLVVIEAARVGTPTIAYNVSGLKDSVLDGKTGMLCDCFPQSLATKVTQLLADNTKYKQLCKNAIAWSKNFSWDKASKLSLELIQKIAG